MREPTDDRPLELHEDRYFDPTPAVRRIARQLYDETRDLPIVGPHGHVEPRILAEDTPFPEPASLIIKPDHYVFRLLYSQGVAMEDLGIPPRMARPWKPTREPSGSGLPSTTTCSKGRRPARGSTTKARRPSGGRSSSGRVTTAHSGQ